MKIPCVSVIVPVYNVEPYLHRCLDSLVNQTIKDIEIICINDCSPDNSLDILKKYAEKYERVKIIDFEKNQGVSVARNSGMMIAKGEYIGFVDPDDYVDLDYYEKLYKLAKEKNADIAKASIKSAEYDGSSRIIYGNMNKLILKHKGYFMSFFYTAIYRNKMLKKHRVKFPVGKIRGQDLCFSTHAVIVAKDVCVLNDTFYYYFRRNIFLNAGVYGTITETFDSMKMASMIKCYCLILNRLNKAIKTDKNYIDIYTLWIQDLLKLLYLNSEEYFIKKIARIAVTYYQKHKFSKKMNLPSSIIMALRNEDAKRLISVLQEWVNNECYPFINIKKTLLQTRKLYVWGAGSDGVKVEKLCNDNGWKISGFLDSNKNIKVFNEYRVKQPEAILNKANRDFFIIISSRVYAAKIAQTCEQAGLKEGVDFWRPN